VVVDCALDRQQAVEGITWVVGLIEEAVRTGRCPSGPRVDVDLPRAQTDS
jgi:hypothetical protein